MQVYRQKFESSFSIPIKYEDVPDSIIFNSPLPDHIALRLRDDGVNLFKYNFRNDTIVINIKNKINKQVPASIIKEQIIEDLIRPSLFKSSEIISYSPSQIDYSYEALNKKSIPVINHSVLDIAAGHIISGKLYTYPDSVQVYGGLSALDTIHYAHTKLDTIRNITSDSSILVELRPIDHIIFKPSDIRLNISVDKFAQKELEVPVKVINSPNHLRVNIFPSSVKVVFHIGIKRLDTISADDFGFIVNYEDIATNQSASSMTIQMVKSPDYIHIQQTIPSELEFVLELK